MKSSKGNIPNYKRCARDVQMKRRSMVVSLGGDEFLLVISHVNAENIDMTINRFREQFSALSFPFAGQGVSISATFGVAGNESGNLKDFDALVRKADEMLYAKRSAPDEIVSALLSQSDDQRDRMQYPLAHVAQDAASTRRNGNSRDRTFAAMLEPLEN